MKWNKIIPLFAIVIVIAMIIATLLQPSMEDIIMVQDKPLSSYKFRICVVAYEIDLNHDGVYDETFVWDRCVNE